MSKHAHLLDAVPVLAVDPLAVFDQVLAKGKGKGKGRGKGKGKGRG